MNKKILTLAVAAGLIAPMATYADVTLSGKIQAEVTGSEIGTEKVLDANTNRDIEESGDRQTLTNDSLGAVFNAGANILVFDIDEKLGGGLTAYARYEGTFDTSDNSGLNKGKQAYVGLKTETFYLRYGKLTGAYKSSLGLIDPWAATSMQARGTGGGMSGSKYNHVMTYAEMGDVPVGVDPNQVVTDRQGRVLIHSASNTNHQGLAHSSEVEGALEAGVKFGGFSFALQGFVDDASGLNGGGLLELRYTAPSFVVFVSGAYTDLDDVTNEVTDTIDNVDGEDDDLTDNEDQGEGNWKAGGQYKLGDQMKIGLQYEHAELGAFDNAEGDYVIGSLAFNLQRLTLAGWVAGYMADREYNLVDVDGSVLEEDALSWAVGAQYHFSKRTMGYLGYRQTDSDNDYRDEDVIVGGIRHVF